MSSQALNSMCLRKNGELLEQYFSRSKNFAKHHVREVYGSPAVKLEVLPYLDRTLWTTIIVQDLQKAYFRIFDTDITNYYDVDFVIPDNVLLGYAKFLGIDVLDTIALLFEHKVILWHYHAKYYETANIISHIMPFYGEYEAIKQKMNFMFGTKTVANNVKLLAELQTVKARKRAERNGDEADAYILEAAERFLVNGIIMTVEQSKAIEEDASLLKKGKLSKSKRPFMIPSKGNSSFVLQAM
jgi:hypothetical protein